MSKLIVLSLFGPILMIVIGHYLESNPVWDIAAGGGYATKQSCKSQENWDYAQIKAPPIFFKVGIVSLSVLVVFLLVDFFFKGTPLPYLGVVTSVGSVYGTYLYVEKLIKENGPHFK